MVMYEEIKHLQNLDYSLKIEYYPKEDSPKELKDKLIECIKSLKEKRSFFLELKKELTDTKLKKEADSDLKRINQNLTQLKGYLMLLSQKTEVSFAPRYNAAFDALQQMARKVDLYFSKKNRI